MQLHFHFAANVKKENPQMPLSLVDRENMSKIILESYSLTTVFCISNGSETGCHFSSNSLIIIKICSRCSEVETFVGKTHGRLYPYFKSFGFHDPFSLKDCVCH